ncbi:MAG: CPBP family intramembrane glutamic endopeptidase [Bacteriovorax sp.]
MQINVFNTKLKSYSENPSILLYGFLGIVLYKCWKYFINIALIEGAQATKWRYIVEQSSHSGFRFLATFLGLIFMQKHYKEFVSEFFIGKKEIFFFNILLIIPVYFLARYLTFGYSFDGGIFFFEFFFNMSVGAFEEIFFRGIILVGLSQYFKPMASIVLSSLLFSLWHFDVVSTYVNYIDIFVWSIYASLCFMYGASLLSLILFHYLWDLVFFGFGWDNYYKIPDYQIVMSVIALISFATFCLFRNDLRKEFRNLGMERK